MIWMILCHSLFVRFSSSLLSNFLFFLFFFLPALPYWRVLGPDSFSFCLGFLVCVGPWIFFFSMFWFVLSYQLARRTPSISPLSPSCRHTNRDISCPRTTPRARPVSLHIFLYDFRFFSSVSPVIVPTILFAILSIASFVYSSLILFSLAIFILKSSGTWTHTLSHLFLRQTCLPFQHTLFSSLFCLLPFLLTLFSSLSCLLPLPLGFRICLSTFPVFYLCLWVFVVLPGLAPGSRCRSRYTAVYLLPDASPNPFLIALLLLLLHRCLFRIFLDFFAYCFVFPTVLLVI